MKFKFIGDFNLPLINTAEDAYARPSDVISIAVIDGKVYAELKPHAKQRCRHFRQLLISPSFIDVNRNLFELCD